MTVPFKMARVTTDGDWISNAASPRLGTWTTFPGDGADCPSASKVTRSLARTSTANPQELAVHVQTFAVAPFGAGAVLGTG